MPWKIFQSSGPRGTRAEFGEPPSRTFKTKEEAVKIRATEYGDPEGAKYSIEEVDDNGWLLSKIRIFLIPCTFHGLVVCNEFLRTKESNIECPIGHTIVVDTRNIPVYETIDFHLPNNALMTEQELKEHLKSGTIRIIEK
jgi:hypothetical protein